MMFISAQCLRDRINGHCENWSDWIDSIECETCMCICVCSRILKINNTLTIYKFF